MKNPKMFLQMDESKNLPCILGKHCYANDGSPGIVFFSGERCKLVIGNFVSFGPQVTIYVGGEHDTRRVSTYPFSVIFDDAGNKVCGKTKGDVVIGSDVWIGGKTLILSGVTIGHGAVIGAGSIVTKDVAPYTIVAGNPVREIRKRFTEEQRQKLLEIQWWEYPDEEIDKFIPLLMEMDIEGFIKHMEGVYAVSERS